MSSPAIQKYMNDLPWEDIIDALDDLAEAGVDEDTAIQTVATIIDYALPMPALVPGAVGVVLEAVDGPVIQAVLRLAWSLAQNKDQRQARRAARQARRLARKAARS